jgi:hypothetical protein
MSRRLCRVTAQWEPGLVPPVAERPAPTERRSVRTSSLGAGWQPPDPRPIDELDPETAEALAAARSGVPWLVDPDGLAWPSRIALTIDHASAPCGWFTEIRRDGDRFTVTGLAEPGEFGVLVARPFLSPGFRIEHARLGEKYGLPVAMILAASVFELTATARPLTAGTSLSTSAPEAISDREVFAVEHSDTLRWVDVPFPEAG